ncbi:hypothetical protein BGZ73_000525 [Actinomortierella ambigua]|nr:hypothetical protein BGZ73_000525 [Actinomortierella ambigua]
MDKELHKTMPKQCRGIVRRLSWEILPMDVIGSGGYGHVYHASWKGRTAAVKKFFVAQEDVNHSDAIRREIDILKTLVDRHIIQFYGTDYHEGSLVLIMDYAEGGCLKNAIDSGRVTDWPAKMRVAQEIVHQPNNDMVVRFVEAGEREDIPEDTPDDYRKWIEHCWTQDPSERPEASEMVVQDDVPDHAGEAQAEVSKLSITDDTQRPSMIYSSSGDAEVSKLSITDGAQRPSMIYSSSGDAEVTTEKTDHTPRKVTTLLSRPDGTDVEGMLALARRYESGLGVGQSDWGAFEWYFRAAQLGSTVAELKTASNLYFGHGTLMNRVAAAYWIRRMAEKGNSEAQLSLGHLYEDGQGVTQDYAEAVSWYRKSADQGNADAQNNLGMMYNSGKGVAQDHAVALSWFRKSAARGNAVAQYHLGIMYENGRGVTRDYTEAMLWYRKSADQENATAQYNLGQMYKKGRGIRKDIRQAVEWYRKAANQGHAEAKVKLAKHS